MALQEIEKEEMLTGIWVSDEGTVHECIRKSSGESETRESKFEGFLWANHGDLPPLGLEGVGKVLNGNGPLDRLLETDDFETFKKWISRDALGRYGECLKPFESQHMLRCKERLFEGLLFDDLKRCQVDIETDSDGVHFSNPYKDRVLAIGMKMGDQEKLLCLESVDAESEKVMLEEFIATLQEWDPDVIEGHNIFSFDLNYLKIRSLSGASFLVPGVVLGRTPNFGKVG